MVLRKSGQIVARREREVRQQVPPAPQCQLFRRATCLMKEDNVCGSADFHFGRFWRGGEGHMNATQFNL